MPKHIVKGLAEERVAIDLFGVGGTGGHVLNGLARMQYALHRIDHPGIYVTAFDPDVVSYENVGRQVFTEFDVGHNKAIVSIDKVNLALRLNWNGRSMKNPSSRARTDIVIACVDTKAARKSINKMHLKKTCYILDCGNGRDHGQVILGQKKGDLPNPYEENPDLISGVEDEDVNCTDPYQRQDLFVNQMVATYALHQVWQLLRRGSIETRGVFAKLEGTANPLKCL